MRGDREQWLGEGLSIFERWQAGSLTRVAWRGVWRRGVWLAGCPVSVSCPPVQPPPPPPLLPPVLQDNEGPDTHAYLVNTWPRASQSKCVSHTGSALHRAWASVWISVRPNRSTHARRFLMSEIEMLANSCRLPSYTAA
jgi:hypothetical protein